MITLNRPTAFYLDASTLALNGPIVDNGCPPLIFVSADNDLLIAAAAEGLATDNPNNHP